MPEQHPVDFPAFRSLPAALALQPEFAKLHEQITRIDLAISSAQSRKRKLKVVTETAAKHLTCLKHAKIIAIEQEKIDAQNARLWLKAVVAIAERATEVMGRANVEEHFSHYEKPRVLRVLLQDGEFYRIKLKERAQTMGIMAKDEADIRFTLEHWQLIVMDLTHEPHDDVIRLAKCVENVAWLESMLAVVVVDEETKC